MVELVSMSKPVSPFEAVAVEAEAPRVTTAGYSGGATDETSRSAKVLVGASSEACRVFIKVDSNLVVVGAGTIGLCPPQNIGAIQVGCNICSGISIIGKGDCADTTDLGPYPGAACMVTTHLVSMGCTG